MRAPLMPASSTSRLKSNCRKFSTCWRVRNAMGTLADWPVEVSIFTKYGYSGCCVSAFMRNTSIKTKGWQGIVASVIELEVAAKRIYHSLSRVLHEFSCGYQQNYESAFCTARQRQNMTRIAGIYCRMSLANTEDRRKKQKRNTD